jgi:hypothetical protein
MYRNFGTQSTWKTSIDIVDYFAYLPITAPTAAQLGVNSPISLARLFDAIHVQVGLQKDRGVGGYSSN